MDTEHLKGDVEYLLGYAAEKAALDALIHALVAYIAEHPHLWRTGDGAGGDVLMRLWREAEAHGLNTSGSATVLVSEIER